MRYSKIYTVLAGQVDVSNHLSNVQYYDFFKSTLFSFLSKNNFSELVKPKDLWPVVFNESCEFHREVLFDQQIRVDVFFSDLPEKKNKWLCTGIMYDCDTGEKLATYKSLHGIMNRQTRKIESLTEAAAELILKHYDSE